MPKIIFTYPDGSEMRLSLEGDVFTIGRADDNDIVLADQRVSSHHAVLKRGPAGEFIVNDLGATNPTRVNGKPTQLHPLQHGDTLLIGDVFAMYESERAAVDPRIPRRAAPAAPVETVGTGCFALLAATLLLCAAWAVLAAAM
jgi:pSer/pThr/pTyr-binding forkhead associated (FHA) protein